MKAFHAILFFASLSICLAQVNNGTKVPTGHIVRPAGKTLSFSSRPVDLKVSPDGSLVFIKTHTSLVIADAERWEVVQDLPYGKDEHASMHGIAVSGDGKTVYLTNSGNDILEAKMGNNNRWIWTRRITLKSKDKDECYPCGIALSKDGLHAYAAISRNNSVGIVDLGNGILTQEIAAGAAPYDVVLSPDEKSLYVSNWGGRLAMDGEHTMLSAGTPIVVDEREIPVSGTVMKIDLKTNSVTSETATGMHPSDMVLSRDGLVLYTANANSDNVSIIETKDMHVLETVNVRPEKSLPFGSITNALALSKDGLTLYAANGGNNAIAVISLDKKQNPSSRITGFIPAGWFPSAVAVNGKNIFIANTKGDGLKSSNGADKNKFFVKHHRGTANKVNVPSSEMLASYTKQVKKDALIPQVLKAFEKKGKPGVKPAPVPKNPGEPSVFKHVIYVIKENRTYDQLFGDLKQANSDPGLCIYGRNVTPNHHALAEQFALLDNYYCNGVVSSEGHQWATQGIITDYQEKSWGGWTRSYDFGSDPLVFAPTNFIWDNVLLSGLTFRNYGEFDFPAVEPDSVTWRDIYNDFQDHTNKIRFRQNVPMKNLLPYTCTEFPGWELRIPDALRIEAFLKEFADYEKKGDLPNFIIVYLPQDHTSGIQDNTPTPRAHLADNDLALGKLVDAVSNSKYWKNTCIFVNEDDPQDGFDHVDGHRSICLVVSPYTKRGKVISSFYNQCSVLHTIANIFGMPPMNQMDALAPTMEDCFTTIPDFTPYKALASNIAINEMNRSSSLLKGDELKASLTSNMMDFSEPDRINDDSMNRILWHNAKGYDKPYPEGFAGAHGKGLHGLKLKLTGDADPNYSE